MSDIKEVDALADFRLTLDHFYTIVKEQVGNLQADQYIQLQATAVPLDVSQKYEWFSRSNLSGFFDVRIDPTPVAENVTDRRRTCSFARARAIPRLTNSSSPNSCRWWRSRNSTARR